MKDDAGKALFRRYVAVWENGNLDGLDQVIGPGYLGHPATGVRDLAGLRERIVAFRAAFPGVRFTFHDQISEGDTVASRMTATALRAADGQPVILHGQNMSRIADGKIAEEWMVWEVVSAAG